MSYQFKYGKLDHGHPLAEGIADEPLLTEAETFELLRDMGMKVADFGDKEEGKRYAEWLKAHPRD